MSPILTRPVREQLEHDRVIRLLEARYRRQHEVAINLSGERNHSVMVGELAVYPDLLLFGQERKRLEGTVEVETGESVNYLEALAEWGPFSRLRVPFALYVPPNAVDSARRLCTEHNIPVAEIWTYHMGIDQVRFTMIHRAADGQGKGKGKSAPRPEITIKQSDVVVVRGTPPLPPESPAPAPAPPPAAPAKAAPAAKAGRTAAPPKAVKAKAVKPARPGSAAKPLKRAAASTSAPKAAPRVPVKVSATAKATIKAKAEAKARALAKTKATMAAKTAKPSRTARATKSVRAARQPAKSAKASKPARAARRR